MHQWRRIYFGKSRLNMRTFWPILYSTTDITCDLYVFYCRVCHSCMPHKNTEIKARQNINSWFPLFDSDIGEIISLGRLPQEHFLSRYKANKTKQDKKALVIDLAEHRSAAWNSTLNYLATWEWSESCKTHEKKQTVRPETYLPTAIVPR